MIYAGGGRADCLDSLLLGFVARIFLVDFGSIYFCRLKLQFLKNMVESQVYFTKNLGDAMSTLFVVIEIILAIAIVGVVLLQKSSSMGLGVYSGSNESLFGAKGPAGFLAKFTMFLALVFLANTIFLGYQFNTKQQKSVFDSQAIEGASTQGGAPLNAPLGAPAGTGGVPNWNLNSAPIDSAPASSGASTAPADSASK